MPLTAKEKLQKFRQTKRLPQAVLLLTPEKKKREEILRETIKAFTDEVISEARGNLIIVGGLESENSEESIKVDDVREILHKLSLTKWDSGGKRFVYIPGAENLTASSSNALLKSLEEPGEGTHFILTSPSRRAILKTILSRCSVVNFYDEDLRGVNQEQDQDQDEKVNKEKNSELFFKAFFEGDFETFQGLNKNDFKIAFEDFKHDLKERFVRESYSGNLDRAYWFDLFDFIDKTELQINTHTDVKWITRAIEEFYIRHSN